MCEEPVGSYKWTKKKKKKTNHNKNYTKNNEKEKWGEREHKTQHKLAKLEEEEIVRTSWRSWGDQVSG